MANGSCAPVDLEEAYAGIVGMETICLGFLLAEMNGLKVCATDISSAYLYTKTREKCYIITHPEFGELKGEKLVIHHSLYGLCTSGAQFHEHLGGFAIWVTPLARPTLIFGSLDTPMGTMNISPTMLMMSYASPKIP